LKDYDFEVQTATLDEPEHGLTPEKLANTDVLVWWGHKAHDEVTDEVVERVQKRILEDGMGLLVLHSGHFSKIFKRLMGTSCWLKWREDGHKERLWVVAPGHPIVEGLGEYIELPQEEMYGEHFDIPEPDTLVFVSWFPGGEVFRSGCCYRRGTGKIFYFRPGHEEYPTYFNPEIQRVIANAVKWAAPSLTHKPIRGNTPPLEILS
jgi:trehalose utilization protein